MSFSLTEIERKFICERGQETLWKDDAIDVKEALEYLRNKRHIVDAVLRDYNFGYVPKRVRHDWSERIIMPLFDPYGNLVILTSRKFRTTKKEEYPHLHETFDKRYYMYGLNVAKKEIIRKNRAVIVEGQFDTTYLQTQGIKTVIGVLGSAFTFEHVITLRRYCSEIYLVFDTDESGKKTLERSMDMLKEQDIEDSFGMSFIPVRLPKEYKDPDEFVHACGAKEFCELLRESKIEKSL